MLPWATSAFKWFMMFCVSPRSPSPRATLPIEANALDPLLPSSSLHDERLAFCGLLAFSGLPTLSASIEQAGRFIADMPTNSSQLAEPGSPLAWLILSTLA